MNESFMDMGGKLSKTGKGGTEASVPLLCHPLDLSEFCARYLRFCGKQEAGEAVVERRTLNKLLSLIHGPPSSPHTGQTVELLLLLFAVTRPLRNLFPATT